MKEATRPSTKGPRMVAGYLCTPARVRIDYTCSLGGDMYVRPAEPTEPCDGEWLVSRDGMLLGMLSDTGRSGPWRWDLCPAGTGRHTLTGEMALSSRLHGARTAPGALAHAARTFERLLKGAA